MNLSRTRAAALLPTLMATFLLAACGDDPAGTAGSGGGEPGSGGFGGSGTTSTVTSTPASNSTSTGNGEGQGGGGQGGSGEGGAQVCVFSAIDLDVSVTFADDTTVNDSNGEGELDRTVSGDLIEAGTTLTIEDGEGGLTTVELTGTEAPLLTVGDPIELRVSWRGYEDYDVASLYIDLHDPLSGALLFAAYAGEPSTVEDAAVGLELGDPTCSEEIEEGVEKQAYAPTITAEGATVEVPGGSTLALGDTGLEAEHQGTVAWLYPEPIAATGIVVRRAP